LELKPLHITSKQKRHLLILFFTTPFLIGMGVDLYVPSLPAIQKFFNVDQKFVQLTISFYMLGYAIGQIILGILSDCYGRKKIFLLSALGFTIVSFMAGCMTSNIYVLIFARFAQGLGIAGLSVISRAIAADLFQGIILAKIMAYISLSWSLGPIIGPFIGGYLAYFFNWQASFYFFSLYGLLVLTHAIVTLLETNLHRQPIYLNIIAKTIARISTNPVFFLGTLIVTLAYATMVIFNIIGPFLIQVNLHYSVVQYAQIALLLGAFNFIGNYSSRKLLSYMAPMRIALMGVAISLVVIVLNLLISLVFATTLYTVVMPTLILFFCEGLIVPNIMGKIMALFPENAGTENAIFGIILAFGVFLCTFFATLLETHTQLPLAAAYVLLFGGVALCFFLMLMLDHQKQDKHP
jgi:MFS family permease